MLDVAHVHGHARQVGAGLTMQVRRYLLSNKAHDTHTGTRRYACLINQKCSGSAASQGHCFSSSLGERCGCACTAGLPLALDHQTPHPPRAVRDLLGRGLSAHGRHEGHESGDEIGPHDSCEEHQDRPKGELKLVEACRRDVAVSDAGDRLDRSI